MYVDFTSYFRHKHINNNLYIKLFQALLSCHVTAVEKNLVSWFVVKEKQKPVKQIKSTLLLILLTVGFNTYSSDVR